MSSTVPYLDTLDWVEKYSWFAFFVSGLYDLNLDQLLNDFMAYRGRKPIRIIVSWRG